MSKPPIDSSVWDRRSPPLGKHRRYLLQPLEELAVTQQLEYRTGTLQVRPVAGTLGQHEAHASCMGHQAMDLSLRYSFRYLCLVTTSQCQG